MRIATLGSHSALQILKGAKDEGFSTVCLCLPGKETPYRSFKVADSIVPIARYEDMLSVQLKDCILVPHASLVSYLGEKVQKLTMPYFGDKAILRVEADRGKQEEWLRSSGLRVPRTCDADAIPGLSIVKFHGAQGGKGYFLCSTPEEFTQKIGERKDYVIQEYIVGVPLYLQYFYSPLNNELELMGVDRRYESNVDGLGRVTAKDQLSAGIEASYTVAGNTPVVLRESLLPEVFAMGEAVVRASRKYAPKGLFGAFCLECVLTPELQFVTFEVSARIVAGTNLYTQGSPYTALRYSEPMSTGRRIAREIRLAIERDELEKVLG